jgi:hypothetical protein
MSNPEGGQDLRVNQIQRCAAASVHGGGGHFFDSRGGLRNPIATCDKLSLHDLEKILFATLTGMSVEAAMIIGAYAVSLLIIERLFRAVKPKLMMLGWFASLWIWLVALPGKILAIVR